jgi:hypothetical protein
MLSKSALHRSNKNIPSVKTRDVFLYAKIDEVCDIALIAATPRVAETALAVY